MPDENAPTLPPAPSVNEGSQAQGPAPSQVSAEGGSTSGGEGNAKLAGLKQAYEEFLRELADLRQEKNQAVQDAVAKLDQAELEKVYAILKNFGYESRS